MSKQDLKDDMITALPDNNTGQISPASLRASIGNTIDGLATLDAEDYTLLPFYDMEDIAGVDALRVHDVSDGSYKAMRLRDFHVATVALSRVFDNTSTINVTTTPTVIGGFGDSLFSHHFTDHQPQPGTGKLVVPSDGVARVSLLFVMQGSGPKDEEMFLSLRSSVTGDTVIGVTPIALKTNYVTFSTVAAFGVLLGEELSLTLHGTVALGDYALELGNFDMELLL